jgi:hypothetical protein
VSGRRARWKMVAAALGVLALGVGAFVAYGALGPTGTPRQQLTDWVAASQLGQTVGTLEGDAARVSAAVAQHDDTGTIHTVCGVLLTDAQSANGELPTPDRQLTVALSEAYTLDYEAGNNCYSGGATGSALLAKSAGERSAAHADLVRALALAESVLGRAVATTTTTEPGGGGIFG